jgi:hypothetical protein
MLQSGRLLVWDLMRWMIFINLPNPSSRTRPWGLLSLLTKIRTRSRKIVFLGSRRIRLTTLLSSVIRLPGQCGILNISQPYRPPQPAMGIALVLYDLLDFNISILLCEYSTIHKNMTIFVSLAFSAFYATFHQVNKKLLNYFKVWCNNLLTLTMSPMYHEVY